LIIKTLFCHNPNSLGIKYAIKPCHAFQIHDQIKPRVKFQDGVLILRGGIVEYSQSVTIQKKFKNLIEIYFLIKISYFFLFNSRN
jgi:hypothetical protein